MADRIYWVGFNLVRGIGSVRVKALLDFFGDLQIAWNAPAQALAAAGLPQKAIDNFQMVRREVDLDRFAAEMERKGITALIWQDEAYPRRLKEIDQAPPVLYVRGQLQPADDWAVAIVGTRRMTAYGRQIAEESAAYLAQQGLTVVSGLARGVDGASHTAAMQAGGRTLAVLGCGVDFIYPPEHRRLAEQILEHGALVSDYAPGSAPDAANFPARNRIISGLSLATVVIEAGHTSGALITATFAAEQGREVLAVPGQIYAPQSKGTNRLIQQGARPLLEPQDILDALKLEKETVNEHRQAQLLLPADDVEASLMRVLEDEALHIDEIGVQSGLPIATVSATLTVMELKGMVRQVGAMTYMAVRESHGTYGTGSDG